MAERYRTHTLALTFSSPLTEKAARAHLANVANVIEAFAVLSKAAWYKEQNPKIERVVVRRKSAP